MNILHTEASTGWGGQEIRILREAEGMRKRGHQIIFAIQTGAELKQKTCFADFITYQLPLNFKNAPTAIYQLISIIRRHKIDLINTHSSQDAWLAGIAAKLTGRPLIRTRHLSTPIREGWNSRILYNRLADYTVTTCKSVAQTICLQANLTADRCQSIPTGVDHTKSVSKKEIEDFSNQWSLADEDFVVGTVCVLRSWKGVNDLLHAAKILENYPRIKWLIVGSGPFEERLKEEWKRLNLQRTVFFTGYLTNPFPAISRMDIFTLLSTANEGVSQASLQAAYYEKPLITTSVGGLNEVCIHNHTGYNVSLFSPQEVADAVLKLSLDPNLRKQMGTRAKKLVLDEFTFSQTLDSMEKVYAQLKKNH